MKKTIFIIIVLNCILLLTGCVKSETTMVINKDKSMDLSITYSVADYLLDLSDENSASEETTDIKEESETWKNLEKRGYLVEKYIEDEYSGFKAKKHIKNIDEISSEDNTQVIMSDFLEDDYKDDVYFKIEKGFFKNKYTANFIYDLKEETQDEETTEEDIDLSAYTSSISIQYKVTLPIKAIKNNATVVSEDGLTYTWKAPYGEVTNINYTFEIPNTSSYVICAIATIIVIGSIVTIVLVKKKKCDNLNKDQEESEESA